MTPTQAATLLLERLQLRKGAAVVWPATRDGKLTLIIRLAENVGPVKRVPDSFEGFPVAVERAGPVSAQERLKPFLG